MSSERKMTAKKALSEGDQRSRFEWQQAMLGVYDKYLTVQNEVNAGLANKVDELEAELAELRKTVPDAKPTKRRVATKPA